jgi:hypothetical protein
MTRQGTWRLDKPCGEQGKLQPPKKSRLPKGTEFMSEQKSSFMQELDLWSEANIVGPLASADPNHQDWEIAVEQVKKALRTKVLESYRNGQKAGPRREGGRHGR